MRKTRALVRGSGTTHARPDRRSNSPRKSARARRISPDRTHQESGPYATGRVRA